jgi:hypothetical protein
MLEAAVKELEQELNALAPPPLASLRKDSVNKSSALVAKRVAAARFKAQRRR